MPLLAFVGIQHHLKSMLLLKYCLCQSNNGFSSKRICINISIIFRSPSIFQNEEKNGKKTITKNNEKQRIRIGPLLVHLQALRYLYWAICRNIIRTEQVICSYNSQLQLCTCTAIWGKYCYSVYYYIHS